MIRCSYHVNMQYYRGKGFSVTTRVHTKEEFLNEVVNKPRNLDTKDAIIEHPSGFIKMQAAKVDKSGKLTYIQYVGYPTAGGTLCPQQ